MFFVTLFAAILACLFGLVWYNLVQISSGTRFVPCLSNTQLILGWCSSLTKDHGNNFANRVDYHFQSLLINTVNKNSFHHHMFKHLMAYVKPFITELSTVLHHLWSQESRTDRMTWQMALVNCQSSRCISVNYALPSPHLRSQSPMGFIWAILSSVLVSK